MKRRAWRPARHCLWLGVALALAGCGPSVSSPGESATAPAGDLSATPASSIVPSPTMPEPPSASPAPIAATASPPTAESRPPAAILIDARSRSVAGQVGTFTWQGVVSDSPLLGGAAATVRTRQVLSITVAGPRPGSWSATLFADPADPASGTALGQGAGEISLVAPDRPGTWTLALQVIYPDGDVIHFWRLTVPG